VLHALTLASFYRYAQDTCLEVSAKMVTSSAQAPGLADSEPVTAIAARHQAFEDVLPREPGELWQALATMDDETRHGLFAHCVGLTVNAVHEPWNRRPRALAHADQIAIAVGLDLAPIWSPTVDTYLGRVTKARIVAAVREAKGDDAAARIADLKKVPMAEQAQVLLAGSGWLPEPLRTPGSVRESGSKAEMRHAGDDAADSMESAANGGDSVVADEPPSEDDADVTAIAIAAE
jgi:ParB family chromosome partitioning protein